MKYLLIIVVGITWVSWSMADMPAYLKDGTITVTLKNGKTYTFSTNEYMVVKRGAKKPAPALEQLATAMKPEPRRNRVRVLGGVGPNGLETTRSASQATVTTTSGAVGGIGYDRLITDEVSVGGAALNNETYLLNIGLDF